MPFGKFRGYEVETLPDAYLLWLVENVDHREPFRIGGHGGDWWIHARAPGRQVTLIERPCMLYTLNRTL